MIEEANSLYRLEELAEVRLGLTMRSGLLTRDNVKQGPHHLRIRDLTGSGEIQIQSFESLPVTSAVVRRHLVVEGDIVVANRGNRLTAALVPKGLVAVASGQLLIVKLLAKNVIKEYLNWYLNHERTQQFLLSRSRGSQVKTLSVSVLKSRLRIPVPCERTQKQIVELNRLRGRERALLSRLEASRRIHVETTLLNIVMKECDVLKNETVGTRRTM